MKKEKSVDKQKKNVILIKSLVIKLKIELKKSR